jgi:hypothetical protein
MSCCCVAHNSDRRSLKEVVPRQLFETQYQSVQPLLWQLWDDEWLKVMRVPVLPRSRPRGRPAEQFVLPEGMCKELRDDSR